MIVIMFAVELFYFRIANYYNIIDKPNHRSSHSKITLRGGGIIFPISLFLYPLYFGYEFKYFLIGLLLIGFISFIDDIKPVANRLRIIFHLTAVGLMFYQLELFHLPFYWILLALFVVIGSINAINFMDGINGITGGYSIITVLTLLYININTVTYSSSTLLITVLVSIGVFNFFNFRSRAKCFAGDVGSVSIAFIIMFFLLQLITKTANLGYLLLLLIYGLDTVTTIIFRIIRKENIFDAHRSHFYQYWANERGISHLIVAALYAIIQLFINFLVVFVLPDSNFIVLLSLIIAGLIFTIIRFSVEGSSKLLGQ